MTAAGMPSGRGRLPGMGAATQPAPAPEPAKRSSTSTPPPASTDATPQVQTRPRQRPTRSTAERVAEHAAPKSVVGCTPQAGEPKVQVNPRIYQSTWRHYEALADQLPRHQRRGALTALVNSILAQHAPRTAEEAREAITWLRQAENADS
jgi:hypothetical protein